MSLLISRTSVIISGTRYLFMFINMFIFLSLFKSFTQVDFKSFLCIKMLALFSVVGVRSPPLGYGLSSDLVSGVLNHIGYVFIVHMFILESSLLYSPTKSSLISCTQMYVNFLSKRRNQTEKLRIGHQKSFPWTCETLEEQTAMLPKRLPAPDDLTHRDGAAERPGPSFCLTRPHACQLPSVQQPSLPLVKGALASLFLNRTDSRGRFWPLPCHSRDSSTQQPAGRAERRGWVNFSERLWPTQDQKINK